MTTILTTRTAHWVICLHRYFERNDRQIKTVGGTELQGQLHRRVSLHNHGLLSTIIRVNIYLGNLCISHPQHRLKRYK